MKKVKMYELKKGDKFKYINSKTGEPEENTYIKGRPHTLTGGLFGPQKMYVTTIYAPGELYDGDFCGYVSVDREVYKVD